MSSDTPPLEWVKPQKRLPGGLGCITVLASIALIVLAGNAGSGERPFTFGRGFFTAVVTNPLCWILYGGILWGLFVFVKSADPDEPVKVKCPHCGHICATWDELNKSALNDVWECSACANNFRKTSSPP